MLAQLGGSDQTNCETFKTTTLHVQHKTKHPNLAQKCIYSFHFINIYLTEIASSGIMAEYYQKATMTLYFPDNPGK